VGLARRWHGRRDRGRRLTAAEAALFDQLMAQADLLGPGHARPWLPVAATAGAFAIVPCIRRGRPQPWRHQRRM